MTSSQPVRPILPPWSRPALPPATTAGAPALPPATPAGGPDLPPATPAGGPDLPPATTAGVMVSIQRKVSPPATILEPSLPHMVFERLLSLPPEAMEEPGDNWGLYSWAGARSGRRSGRGVRCHVSRVTCHMSHVIRHMSHITIFCLFLQNVQATQWRVCYQRGLPHLVSIPDPFFQ